MTESVAEGGEVDLLRVSGVCWCDDIYGCEMGVECAGGPSEVWIVWSDELVGFRAVLLVCVAKWPGLYWGMGEGGRMGEERVGGREMRGGTKGEKERDEVRGEEVRR